MKPASGAKSLQCDPKLQPLENWLRYYEDLGIRSFYVDRAAIPPGVQVEVAAVADGLPAPDTTPTESARILGKQEPQLAKPAASSAATSAATSVVPAVRDASTPRLGPHPGLKLHGTAGPSLFEAAERVTGDTLERISADLGECTRCKLHKGRNKIVFGVGNPRAELVFVGEGPGHDEDVQGVPFVGRAGKLLTQMIEAMGLRREDVYIANVVKCRPPENRAPEKDEVATCMPYLVRQLAAISPKVIVCLGSVAAQAVLGTTKGISQFRGQWMEFRGSKLMATYHPAYLLRNPAAKPEVWGDLKKVMAVLGLMPPRSRS